MKARLLGCAAGPHGLLREAVAGCPSQPVRGSTFHPSRTPALAEQGGRLCATFTAPGLYLFLGQLIDLWLAAQEGSLADVASAGLCNTC